MKLIRWAVWSGLLGAAGYWLVRYLRPEHSPLVLNNSVVLITGASGGIGRAFARTFARHGARVVLAARRAELLEEVRQEIEPYAADVLVLPTDVSDNAQLKALVDTTLSRYGQIDLLINNAGVILWGVLQTKPPDEIRRLIDVNLASAMVLTRLCLPSMLARRSGKIINVASMAGRIPSPFQVAYAPSKAGLLSFSEALRRQLNGTGVEVVTVLPSFTLTDMVSPGLEDFARQMGLPVDPPDYVAERTLDGILKGREEITFGGVINHFGAWVDRHFPLLARAGWRTIMTPERYAAAEDDPVASVEVWRPALKHRAE